ncbi:hypothetical protein D9611_005723 [Ephemerocybe angulata]|uniref:CN hydrolase domain-containing protein n=1 Tax=Ephemerocybe angulata TaxID=980116 RepID=A0A8H5BHW4_9AGAR|nr:hypothetical protein D9611_005723 [Tulosesus angulatus]
MSLLSRSARDLFSRGKGDLAFVGVIGILTSCALAPTTTIVPTILALATLHAFSRIVFPSGQTNRFVFLAIALSVGGAIPNVSASLEALSTAVTSLVALLSLSSLTSFIVLAASYVEWRASRRVSSPFARMLLLPAIWSTIWCMVSYINPFGHLLTWSRGNTLEAYRWLIPFLGTSSQDWIAAAWAVVLSEVYQVWYMGPMETQDEDTSDEDTTQNAQSYTTPLLATFLLLLIVPSYFVGNVLPLPVGRTDDITPFGVGCIIPPYQVYKHHQLTLNDYIDETVKYQNRAKFLLWPEGAVSFDSDSERDAAFATIRANVSGSYVGVSFEQYVTDPTDSTGRKSQKKTGIVIIGHNSPEPHLTYYKRHLVPFAESYRLSHSLEPPALVDIPVSVPSTHPTKRKPTEDRNVSVTASVCLDFAMPLPFSHLDSRPGLILAPARTWEQSVGISMWLQAKQRAEELNTMVLWCDGGDGGVSGVAGGGYESFEQVGTGSWVKNIGLEYPFTTSRTFHARPFLEDLAGCNGVSKPSFAVENCQRPSRLFRFGTHKELESIHEDIDDFHIITDEDLLIPNLPPTAIAFHALNSGDRAVDKDVPKLQLQTTDGVFATPYHPPEPESANTQLSGQASQTTGPSEFGDITNCFPSPPSHIPELTTPLSFRAPAYPAYPQTSPPIAIERTQSATPTTSRESIFSLNRFKTGVKRILRSSLRLPLFRKPIPPSPPTFASEPLSLPQITQPASELRIPRQSFGDLSLNGPLFQKFEFVDPNTLTASPAPQSTIDLAPGTTRSTNIPLSPSWIASKAIAELESNSRTPQGIGLSFEIDPPIQKFPTLSLSVPVSTRVPSATSPALSPLDVHEDGYIASNHEAAFAKPFPIASRTASANSKLSFATANTDFSYTDSLRPTAY